MNDLLDRKLPYDLDAEMAVLGSCLLAPDAIDDVALALDARDFFDEGNRVLYENMHAMYQDGKPVDVTLLCDRMKRAGVWEVVGGASYVAKVGQAVANAAYARHYAAIVADHAKRRAMIQAATSILRDAYEDGDIDAIVSNAEEMIFAVREHRSANETVEIRTIIDRRIDELDKRLRGDETDSVVPTGFSQLDATLAGGFRPGQLIVVAARPSMGKSALTTDVCRHVAESGRLVLFVSLEMSSDELGDRVLVSESAVDGHRMRTATLSAENRSDVLRAAARVSAWKMHVQDDANLRPSAIASFSRRLARRAKMTLGLLAVDYLQIMEAGDDRSRDGREREVASNARALKRLAKELGCPVLCVAQLNRKVEDRADHRPKLSDLRESGAIEQDADVVLFVHREEYFLTGEAAEQAEGKAEIIVAKQRNGPAPATVELRWDKRSMRFQNLAVQDNPNYDPTWDRWNAGGESF